MAKKGPDFQQILLEHGERIGIGIAAGLAVLLIVVSLFLPGSGMFSGSPEEKEKALTTLTDNARRRMNDPNNVPGDADKPDKDSDKKIIALDVSRVTGDKFQLAALVPPYSDGALGRRVPKVYAIDEANAAFRHVQVQSFIFGENGNVVYALDSKAGARGGAGGRLSGLLGGARRGGKGGSMPGGMPGMPGGMPGMPGGMPGMPGLGGMVGRGGSGPGLPSGDGGGTEFKVVQIRLTDWEKRANEVIPAQEIVPLRMAIIAGSFPLRKQVEEFQAKLGLRSTAEVFAELSQETSPTASMPLNSFRFLGVNVQRRELDGDGNPIGEFAPLDLTNTYRPYAIRTGLNFQEEDPALAPVLIPGLVMKRLKQFRKEDVASAGATAVGGTGRMTPGGSRDGGEEGGILPPGGPGVPGGMPPGALAAGADKAKNEQYPAIEKELANIKKTLEALRAKNVEVPRIAERFSGDRFDPFAPAEPSQPVGMGPDGMGTGPLAPPGAVPGRGGSRGGPAGMRPPGMGEGPETYQELEVPEYALVRLIDVTVQPGKSYEYRLQIRMANPNYNRRDVASVAYATDKELLSEWSKIPIRITIPNELRYYAVDQMEIEKADNPRARYEGPYRLRPINKEREVVLQVHRWLERTTTGGGSEITVGDWAVAERVPVYRGEYAGRRERVELPVWRYSSMDFVIAKDSSTTRTRKGIEVNFGYQAGGNQPEAIVVDFQQGGMTYERVLARTESGVETRKVSDVSAAEVVLLRPDGRLLLLEGGLDAIDETREEILNRVRDNLNNVKNKASAAPGGGGIFGGDN